jgi:hypothetical protein
VSEPIPDPAHAGRSVRDRGRLLDRHSV